MISRGGIVDRLNTKLAAHPVMKRYAACTAMFITALFFALWAMRGVGRTDICYPDQARHAMNGAALHDLVRDRAFSAPVAYLRDYFAHYPALSMPYHPPVFPIIEAAFFGMLGISLVTARFVVALFVFGVGILLFRLVIATEASVAQAYASVVVFLSLPLSQRLAGDIMLEMPALFFVLASVLWMSSLPQTWTTRNAILAGVFAGIAVWTKQTVFLGLIPFMMIIISGRWMLVRTRALWLFGVLYGVSVAALSAVWAQAGGSGFAANWEDASFVSRLMLNVSRYGQIITKPAVAGFILAVVALAVVMAWRSPGNGLRMRTYPLYVAWIAAGAVILLVVPARNERYLWFAYPPVCIILVSLSYRLLRIVLPMSAGQCLVCAASAFFVANSSELVPKLTGPSEAARDVVARGPGRVLVAGPNNGSIIFGIRSIYAGHGITILRGDKLPSGIWTADGMETFAHRFGLNTMVFEIVPIAAPWNDLVKMPARSMHLERMIDQRCTDAQLNGKILIYRFLNPSSTPESTLRIPVFSTGQYLDLHYK